MRTRGIITGDRADSQAAPMRSPPRYQQVTARGSGHIAPRTGTSTGPVIRIRPPVANSISITPALSGDGGDTVPASGVIATGLNAAGICVRSQSCRRQRNLV
jgi:hypothetical protein